MLLKTLYIPEVFSKLPQNKDDANWYCSLLISFLKDVTQNCIVLTDSNNEIQNALYKAIGNWPPKYRRKGQMYIRRLATRHRFIGVSNDEPVNSSLCGHSLCNIVSSISKQTKIDFSLGVTGCQHCMSLPNSADLGSYVTSQFYVIRDELEALTLNPNEWSKENFEEEIWRPLFQYAKHVMLFDRMVGRKLRKFEGRYEISKNYDRGLRWIFEQYMKYSEHKPSSYFEIICGLEPRCAKDKGELMEDALQFWAQDRRDEFPGLPLIMSIKRERMDSQLNHDRYLITDQIAFSIGRGSDLLDDNGCLRDIKINLEKENNRSKIITAFTSVDDV